MKTLNLNSQWLAANNLTLTKKQVDSFNSEVYNQYAESINIGKPRNIEEVRQQAYEKVTK